MKKILIIVSTVLMLFAFMSCESMGYVLAGISDGMAGAGYGSSSSSSSSYGSNSSYSSSSSSYSSSSTSYTLRNGRYWSPDSPGEIRLNNGRFEVGDRDGSNVDRSGTYSISGNRISFSAYFGSATIYDSETFYSSSAEWDWVGY